jgi:hypothetical protein
MRNRIEAVVDRIIEERRWRPFRDREITITRGGPPIAACITLQDRRIHLSFAEEFDRLVADMIREHALNLDSAQATEAIVSHLFVHEYNHHQYCPANEYLFGEIIDGIREILEPRELRESRVRALAFEIHNMFSDTVINTIESHKDGRYRDGQALAALLMLYHRSRQSLLGARTDNAMQLFLESNLYLCGLDESVYRQMRRYMPRFFRGEQQVLAALLGVFLEDAALVDRAVGRALLETDSRTIVDRMCDCGSWRDMARNYAAVIHPYLKQDHPELQNGFTGKSPQEGRPAPPDAGNQGKCQGGRAGDTPSGDGKTAERPGQTASRSPGESGPAAEPSEVVQSATGRESTAEDPRAPGNESNGSTNAGRKSRIMPAGEPQNEGGNSSESEDRSGADRKSPIYGSRGVVVPLPPMPPGIPKPGEPSKDEHAGRRSPLRQMRPVGPAMTAGGTAAGMGIGIGTGEDRGRIADFGRLDQLYTERAGKLLLEDEEPAGPNLEMLAGSEETGLGDPAGLRLPPSILLQKTDGSMYIVLRKRVFPVPLDTPVVPDLGGLPDLCFVYDSSGSMDFNPEAGQGKYHIAMLTFYSILHGLQEKGVAPLLRYNGINFSNVTFSSGWQPYSRIDEVKRALFSYQGGGTTIAVKELTELREQRKDRYIILLFSDMAISNADELVRELIETSSTRAATVLVFKLDGEDLSTEKLRQAGIEVFYPRDAQDFMNSSIRIIKDTYAGALA